MIRFDEFTFSLSRLWVAVGLLCLLDFVLVSWMLTGVPRVSVAIVWMPRIVAHAVLLYGPFILGALWLVIVLTAVAFHGWRGLWFLLAALLILPATYLHWVLVWNCGVSGECL